MRKSFTGAIVIALMGSAALQAAPNPQPIYHNGVGFVDTLGPGTINDRQGQSQLKKIRLDTTPNLIQAQDDDSDSSGNGPQDQRLNNKPGERRDPDASGPRVAPQLDKRNLDPVRVTVDVPDHDGKADTQRKTAAKPTSREASLREATASLPRRHVGANEEKPAGKDGDRRYYTRVGFSTFVGSANTRSSLINGCPAAFSQTAGACRITKDQAPAPYRFLSPHPDWWGLSTANSGRFFYEKGYLIRVSPDNRINGYFPLPGGALSPGRIWPKQLKSHNLPDYYRAYFNLGRDDGYRFIDHIIYRLDPENQLITSIAALMTGTTFTIGKPLPSGYDIYNMPHAYRKIYADSDKAHYRYSDGYIYQVDPKSRFVTSVIELIPS